MTYGCKSIGIDIRIENILSENRFVSEPIVRTAEDLYGHRHRYWIESKDRAGLIDQLQRLVTDIVVKEFPSLDEKEGMKDDE